MTKTEMEAKMREACHRGVALFEDPPCYPVESDCFIWEGILESRRMRR